MIKRIRLLALGLMALYAVLFVALNMVQLVRADTYRAHPSNTRDIVRDFSRPRGAIQTADGHLLAHTIEVPGELERLRVYPLGELFAHITGHFSLRFGATGIEDQYNDELAGATREIEMKSFSDLFVERDRTADVTLTLRRDVQEAARTALGGRRGSVVALDPRTGALLAMWTFPSYDPNLFSSHDLEATGVDRDALLDDPANPLLAKAYREVFAPGSTFKVVTATAGLDSGLVTADEPLFPESDEYVPPQTTRPITNFNGSTCGGPMSKLLRVSCNTGFAEMGVHLGAQIMTGGARAFGFSDTPPIDLPNAAESFFPEVSFFGDNIPLLAQSAIGQFEVAATPLQMALVVAGIANDGIVMRPMVTLEVRDSDGSVVDSATPRPWRQAASVAAARQMQAMMENVVNDGTATGMQIDGVRVAAKTGTAEIAEGSDATHAWLIAFAPVEAPRVAIAVVVEADLAIGTQTGGRVAAPIAREVLLSALNSPAA